MQLAIVPSHCHNDLSSFCCLGIMTGTQFADYLGLWLFHCLTFWHFLRCDLLVVIAEMDRILRPGGYVLIQDTMEMMKKLRPILESLRWSVNFYQGQFLVGKKSFWRPQAT